MTRELTHVAWQAPPNGFYKANWDAAIDKEWTNGLWRRNSGS
jgi:hypothetical protein